MPIHGYPGNVITANPVAPTSTVATGVWTTEQQLKAVAAGNWPLPGPPQPISRSLRFNNADSANLTRTPGSAATSSQKFTLSFWVKRTNLSTDGAYIYGNGTTSGAADAIGFNTSDQLNFEIRGTNDGQLITTQVFRDVSSWYHIVYSVDTTQATASNRIKVYVNGVQITAFGTASYPSQNYNFVRFNQNTYIQYIGFIRGGASSIYYLNGYLAEIYDIDGQALTPSSFGQTNASTGVWEPIPYTGTYGTNGFYVNFSDNSNTTAATLGKDYSGNGNNWTPNNFSVTAGAGNDSLVDSPTSYGTDTGVGGTVRGNYCTWNPLSTGRTLSNGNLDYAGSASGVAKGTLGVSSGKWYWEILANGANSSAGVASVSLNPTTSYCGSTADSWCLFTSGDRYNNGSATSGYSTFTTNDIISIALDMDNGKVYWAKNGVWQGSSNPATGTNAGYTNLSGYTITPANGNNNTNDLGTANFGQRAFAYTAPSGFKALCTQNLPTPTIGATSTTQANDYMNVVLYSGTLSTVGSNQLVTGVGFQPDFTWIKCRSNAANHIIADSLRYVSTTNNNTLNSNTTDAEADDQNTFRGFDSDGFNVGYYDVTGNTGKTYVAWNWKANGAGSSNTAGTITSTVSANTTSGFSIATYTGNGTSGATVGHGIGVAPSMIMIKERATATWSWGVYHASVGNTAGLYLNLTNAANTTSVFWNNTSPTSSVFSVGNWGGVNGNTSTYVAYCFAAVAGYSAFGSYTGNGSTDGPFVYTGFRPRYVMWKRSDTGGANQDWIIHDTARSTYNAVQFNNQLVANSSVAEGKQSDGGSPAGPCLDILSNGFKLRDTTSYVNANGGTFIYAAFAESPFKYALAR